MSLLLDTHVVLWWLGQDPGLSEEARNTIASDPQVFVSAATAWEIAIKQNTGKLRSPADLEAQLARHSFEHLPITLAHALRAGSLPKHHNDPFDRMLVAQAAIEGLTLVTRDSRIARYGVATLPA